MVRYVATVRRLRPHAEVFVCTAVLHASGLTGAFAGATVMT